MAETIEKKKISELEEITTLSGTENLLLSVPGGNKRATAQTMKEFVGENSAKYFAAFVEGYVSVIQGSATVEDGAVMEVVYLTDLHYFANRKTVNGGVSYYSEWNGHTDYQTDFVPRHDKLFFCSTEKTVHVWNGALEEVENLTLKELIQEEVQRAMDAESALQTAIQSETDRATNAESALQGNIESLEAVNETQNSLLSSLDATINPLALEVSGGGGVYKSGTTQTVELSWNITHKGETVTPTEITVNDEEVTGDVYTESVTTTKVYAVKASYDYEVMNGVTSTLTAQATTKVTFVDPLLYGFSTLETMTSEEVVNLGEYVRTSPKGTFTLTASESGYMWLCVPDTMSISKVTLNGFDVPMESYQSVDNYRCYRSSNQLVAGSYTIVIS